MKKTAFILSSLLMGATPSFGQTITPQIDCGATAAAWSYDPKMKQYLNDYSCVCDERTNSLKCTRNQSPSAPATPMQHSSHSHRGSDSNTIMLKAFQNALNEYMADSVRISRAVAAQSQANKEMVQQQNQLQSEIIKNEELRLKIAAQNDRALKSQSSLDLMGQLQGLPQSGSALTISDALAKDSQQKLSLAQKRELCKKATADIEKIQSGLHFLDEAMDKNQKLINASDRDRGEAVKDAGKESAGYLGGKAADALEDKLKEFAKTRKNLQLMKKQLDEVEKGWGYRKNARKLTRKQLMDARKWIDDGVAYGDEVLDSAKLLDSYNNSSRPHTRADGDAISKRAIAALKDFNDRFMNDAGGWEFAGEHLSLAVGGPAAKLAFQQAVLGIKLSYDAGLAAIDTRDISRFRKEQEKLEFEKSKRLQKIIDLKKVLEDNHCQEVG